MRKRAGRGGLEEGDARGPGGVAAQRARLKERTEDACSQHPKPEEPSTHKSVRDGLRCAKLKTAALIPNRNPRSRVVEPTRC